MRDHESDEDQARQDGRRVRDERGFLVTVRGLSHLSLGRVRRTGNPDENAQFVHELLPFQGLDQVA